MSFILDALKKSESERHRQSGPVLMDVRIAAPRRRIPAWAWVIAAVLVVNLGVLAWVLWLSPHRAGAAPAASSPSAAAPEVAPAAVVAGAAPVAVAAAPTTTAGVAPADPGMPASAMGAPGATTSAAVAPVSGVPAVAAPATAQSLPGNAQLPPGTTLIPPAPAAQNIDLSTLPRVSDMVAAGVGLPELRLSLHVYDPLPQNRYVLLNGMRLREGDFTQEGVRVLAIAPTGVVVEWRNRRMLLGAGG